MAGVAAAVAGGIASSAASKLLSGGDKRLPGNPTIRNVSTSGLSTALIGGRLSLTRNQSVTDTLARLNSATGAASADLAGLREQFIPGLGRLTRARIQTIRNARSRATGNLRENLSRRRVLGSSFAQDAETRSGLEFAQAEEEARAKSILEEIDITTQFIESEFRLRSEAASAELDQLNFESGLAANLATGTQTALTQNARLQAELAIGAAQGSAKFFEPAIGAISDAVGSKVGDFFGGFNDPSLADIGG